MKLALALAFAGALALGGLPAGAAEGDEILGTPAPGWGDLRWAVGPSTRWEDLRGKVVLVRWWTGPSCPYCIATAPTLRALHDTYGPRGLQVVGLFHPKPRPRPTTLAEARDQAREKGFSFPVAIDDDWKVLRAWWRSKGHRSWTSISFLVDRLGVIRWIHPGGEYHARQGPHTDRLDRDACVASHHALKKKIEALLAEGGLDRPLKRSTGENQKRERPSEGGRP
jgi:peroxiredoxin